MDLLYKSDMLPIELSRPVITVTKYTIFQALFDYEVDSDDEWEEEDPGESVSSDEVWKYFTKELSPFCKQRLSNDQLYENTPIR